MAAAAAAAAAARRGRRRVVVLALLLALVLAPMLLYGGAPIPTFSDSILARIAFDREASNLVARNEAGERLNALPQDSFDVVKEPVWMVASNLSLAKDLGGPGEHKNRVLEATNDEQVGVADSKHHELEHSDVSGETEEGGLQDAGEAEDNTEAVVVDNSNAQSGQNGKFQQDGHHEGAMDAAGEMRESTDDEVQNGEEMEAELPDTSEEERSDEHTESGQDGVIEQVVDRESGTNRAGETGESKDTRMQNGEEMEIESQDASAMEHKNEVVTATKSASHARKGSGVSNDGTGKARENNNDGTHGALDLNASTKKENTADASSKPITHAASRGSETRSRISNADHSTTLPDSTVRIIRDQLKRARTYIGFLASRGNHGFVKDLRAQMRDIQQEVGDATSDQQLPKNVHVKIRAMEQTLANIKQVHDRCSAVINKLRASHRSTEEQLLENKKEANYLVQIAAKAVPKGLHCLALRLTNEYYSTSYNEKHFPHEEKFEDPKLYHYALFSDNVLAAAVVVNSTLVNAKKPANHVFHIVTDRLNYAAMKMLFLDNPFGKAAIQVQNIEEFTWLNSSYSPVLKQLESQSMINYYFRAYQAKPDENLKFRNPKYLSILNHLRFYLPEMFPKLNKVLFLDDDTVVQQDLSTLWSINLNSKVNGAVDTCGESFHRFDKYLNFSNPLIAKKFDPHACGWAYGMNMFDLVEWRKQNITDVYHSWQKLNENRLLWKLGTLPAGLVTFWNRTFPLDRTWHQLGLGYNPNIYPRDIERAAVIHYNGNLKPWLEIGLPKYRKYWSKYVNFDQVFLRECNINP